MKTRKASSSSMDLPPTFSQSGAEQNKTACSHQLNFASFLAAAVFQTIRERNVFFTSEAMTISSDWSAFVPKPKCDRFLYARCTSQTRCSSDDSPRKGASATHYNCFIDACSLVWLSAPEEEQHPEPRREQLPKYLYQSTTSHLRSSRTSRIPRLHHLQ